MLNSQITDNKKGEEWTKITFTPDLKRFGMNGIDDDTYALMTKRVYDMAGTVRDIKVTLNDERLKVKNFKQVCSSLYDLAKYTGLTEKVRRNVPSRLYSSRCRRSWRRCRHQATHHLRGGQQAMGGGLRSFRWSAAASFVRQLDLHHQGWYARRYDQYDAGQQAVSTHKHSL